MGFAGALSAVAAATVAPPAPWGPVPSARQLRWHELEFYGMLHFGLNTFTDKEWGFGDTSPARFNPTDFDADQIVSVAQAAGIKGLILVCKHHDGFCLWPTKTTDYSVRHSPWRGGHGDVVREVAEACRRHGLLFGVYLSAWDRHHHDYGRPAYVACFRAQLRELLTQYGPVFMAWFDGANAGEGYYGVGRAMRAVNGRTYYQWPSVWALIRQLQPQAVIFSDVGPDVRWVGNEAGRGSDPCWDTMTVTGRFPGGPGYQLNGVGQRDGDCWIPPECDVSIRPGWFYHAREDGRVKSAKELLALYFQSVGRGASLNLNVPPDRRGQIAAPDERVLRHFGAMLRALFAVNLTAGATATASSVRGNDPAFAASQLLDIHRATYWTTDDSETTGAVVITFPRAVRFNVVRLREYLPLGQRVEGFALDVERDGQWQEVSRGHTIGSQRLLRLAPHTTRRLRLRITQAAACPAISEVSVYCGLDPTVGEVPSAER